MNKKTDMELVVLAIDGDQKAYTALMSRFRDSVYFHIMRMVGDQLEADDMTVATFGKAFKNLHTYSDKYAFSTWLFTIANNTVIDNFRKKKSNRTFDSNDSFLENTLESPAPNPEEKMIKAQTEDHILKMIDKLKPDYKQLLEMRYINGFAYEEIAEKLNMPLGTVKTKLFRAKASLSKLLDKESDVD